MTNGTDDTSAQAYYLLYVKKDYAALAALTQSALERDPGSYQAALFYFLADWYVQGPDSAARFIVNFFAHSRGASSHLVYCAILGLIRLHPQSAQIIEYTKFWLKTLSADDIRSEGVDEGEFELSVLGIIPMADRSSSVGAPIIESMGPLSFSKSVSPKLIMQRWSLPSSHVVPNARVSTDEWLVFDEHYSFIVETFGAGYLLEEPRVFHRPVSKLILVKSPTHALLKLPNQQLDIDEPCILLGDSQNYYYWLLHCLGRLRAIEGLHDYRALPVLVGEKLSAMQYDSLRQLGIADDKFIRCPSKTVVNCTSLIVPTLLASAEVAHPAAVRWVRERFGPAARDPDYPSRIFVTRTKVHRRRFVNEDDVYEALQPLGFVKVAPDTLNFEEQSKIFQNAEIVVSPFGTCLTGIIFAPLDCRILEIIEEVSIPVHRFNENIALTLGQKFECIVADHAGGKSTTNTSEQDFVVDPQMIREAILQAI